MNTHKTSISRRAAWAAVWLATAMAAGPAVAQAQAAPAPGGTEMQHGARHMMMQRMGHAGHAQPLGHIGRGAGPRAGGMMWHERQLDAVGANAEQKARIREIFRAAHADVAKDREAQRDLHRQMAPLMAAPQVDAAAAEALRQRISAGQDARSKRMLQAMLDAGAVLSAEQRQNLAERVAKRRELMERHHRERLQLDAPRS